MELKQTTTRAPEGANNCGDDDNDIYCESGDSELISSDADIDDNQGGSARLQAGGVLRRAKPNWPEPDLGQPAAAGPPLVHYETFQNHETVNSLHLPCPAWSFTASLLSNELHEHWAVYVVGVGARVVKRETVTSHRTRSQLHITGEHAQPSTISATLEGQGEGPILRFYKLDAKFTQFYEGRGNALCKMAIMCILINFASMTMSRTLIMCEVRAFSNGSSVRIY